MSKFVVLDVVFYANSLNYDQGSGNIQELKKITKWDGKQYTLVSRYALRYSILHHANNLFGDKKWPLAGSEELNNDEDVVQASGRANELIKQYPEFDLFGYMMTESGSAANTRRASATISHAISLTPFNFDNLFNANIDVARRSGYPDKINPYPMEEHYTYYVYSIVMDLNRIGVDEEGEEELDKEGKSERVKQLLEAVSTLKRQIKGRSEDLSPKLMLVGMYENKPYQSFKDRISLADEYQEEVTQTEEKVENGTKTIRRRVKTNKPLFEIYGLSKRENTKKENIKKRVEEFVNGNHKENEKVLFLKADDIKVRFPSQKE